MGRKRRQAPSKKPLLDPELPTQLEALGFNRRHALRIWGHLFAHPAAESVSELRDLPLALRDILAEHYCACTSTVKRPFWSADGTVKLLVRLHDGYEVESVIINQGGDGEFNGVQRHRMKQGATLCVSSQIGCRMACKFCATGTLGHDGDVAAHEILEQLRLARTIRSDVKNIVFMGMGEPLDNFDAVLAAVKLMISEALVFQLGGRPVTLSTVGPTARAIGKLIDVGLAGYARLALSLHAPNQSLREEIVPSAKGSPLEDLMAQIDAYHEAAGLVSRRARNEKILIEYCLLAGVNDSEESAKELGMLLRPRRENVLLNIIPYNSVPGAPYGAPSAEAVQRFHVAVTNCGVQSHVRRQLGNDIAAACGQLARDERHEADIEELNAQHSCAASSELVAATVAAKVTNSSLHLNVGWASMAVLCFAVIAAVSSLKAAHPRHHFSLLRLLGRPGRNDSVL